MEITPEETHDYDCDQQQNLKRHERDLYCLKCKAKTKNTSFYKYTLTSNQKYRLLTVCAVCGSKKSVLVNKSDVDFNEFIDDLKTIN
jgi:RNase P subunit RPR2